MLKIRMQRTGRINMPSFRIVVVEHTSGPKAGNIVEKVGVYNPKSKERVIDTERVKYWMSVGAKPSDTVHNMLVSLGVISGKKINILPAYKPARTTENVQSGGEPVKEEVKAAASAEGSSEPKEAPAEVAPVEASTESSEAPAKVE